MSKLNTITVKFFDSSGKYVINLNVKSRYAGSPQENFKKTDSNGFFVFQGSPDRTIEILAKPPNQQDYILFKSINSSENNSISIKLPKTIDEYNKISSPSPNKGIVSVVV